MNGAPVLDSLPLTLLTGFLGSGKTTLLRRALSDPAFSDTAVVINEIGEIAIDHYLVDFVEGEVLELPGGCLCCAVREDLAETLRSLIERRDAGDIRRFGRIVVETSGLADPGPILFTLGTDPMLDQRLRLARVVTLVDAVTGADTLARFAEAARQAAVADALVISKTDLAPFDDALRVTPRRPQPRARSASSAPPRAIPPRCCSAGRKAPTPTLPRQRGRGTETQSSLLHPPPQAAEGRVGVSRGDASAGAEAAHTHGVATFTIILDAPVSRLDFARALGGLAQDRGNDLLARQGPRPLRRPPGPAGRRAGGAARDVHAGMARRLARFADQRSRLVFIVHDIAPDEILARFAFAAPRLIGPPASGRHAGETPRRVHAHE